jgi:hypothetical protein
MMEADAPKAPFAMNGRRPDGRLCGGFNERYFLYGNLPRRAP